METARACRAAVSAPAKIAEIANAKRSPARDAFSVSPDPKAITASPASTAAMVKNMRRVIGSRKKTLL